MVSSDYVICKFYPIYVKVNLESGSFIITSFYVTCALVSGLLSHGGVSRTQKLKLLYVCKVMSTAQWTHLPWQNGCHFADDIFKCIFLNEYVIISIQFSMKFVPKGQGWVGLWGFLWWAPSAKAKDHHGVSSGWSSVWHRSNTGLSSTQYEQIPIILGVWPFWLTPFFFRSITFWWACG